MYLVKKNDLPTFIKRQDQNICCSMDISCFTCGRKRRSVRSIHDIGFYDNPTSDNDDGILLQMIAKRYGVLPIETRYVNVPDDFHQVRLGDNINDWTSHLSQSQMENLLTDLPSRDQHTEYVLLTRK